ncbi:MAG: 23S rRNA (guanosine(2251)-2'-O)-methyltransferase RlmB, partial [Firmicutes bacterium]|nr:23S rRNA (guanosine(2251)-2'-O)-methyltransferase RlmB [Bacillota bacterium]
IRTADCAGAHGVIIPKRYSAGLTDTVAKASAGAIEYVPVARVANIAQTIDTLKEKGIWVYACDMDGELYTRQDMKGKLALVIGSEGFGISRLVKEKCDFTVSIPMRGHVNSLNASNAACAVMYEVRRQRDLG